MGLQGSTILMPTEWLGFTFFAGKGEKDLPRFLGEIRINLLAEAKQSEGPEEEDGSANHKPEAVPP